MPVQKLLLRIILIALLIAAMVGAAGILFARSTVIAQIDGTLVLTAICCGFLLRISRKAAAHSRPMLLPTSLVVLEFAFGTLVIWQVNQSGSTAWAAVQMMFAVAVSGIPAVIFLRLRREPVTRVAGWTGLILSAVVLVLWTTSIALHWSGGSSPPLAGIGNALGSFGMLGVICLVGVDTDRWYWRWIGVICAIVGMVIAIRYIHIDLENWHLQPLLALSSVGLIVAHANVACRCPLRSNQKWILIGTIVSIALACLFLNLGTLRSNTNIWDWDDKSGYARYAGAAAILGSCGTIALAILYRLNSRWKVPGSKSVELHSLAVVCPVCQKKQTLHEGQNGCDGCGLLMTVKLEEPRCAACGYSLLMFKGDKCPECGATVGAKENAREASLPGV